MASTPQNGLIPVYLDCESGIEAALALHYLISAKDVAIVGIGVASGSKASREEAEISLRLLELLGSAHIPVGAGTADAGARTRATKEDMAAPDLLTALSLAHCGQLRVLTTGALTNLAVAISRDQSLAGRLHSVTIVGGAVDEPGDATRFAETNIFRDPEAAATVIETVATLTLVPLDATSQTVILESLRSRLRHNDSPMATALAEMFDRLFEFGRKRSTRLETTPFHHPVAAAIAVGHVIPRLSRRGFITVDTSQNATRGRTEFRAGKSIGREHQVIYSVDEAFGAKFLKEVTT